MTPRAKEDGINNFVRPDDPGTQATVVPEIIDPLLMHARGVLGGLGVAPAAVKVNLLATAGMRYAEGLHGRPAVDRLYDTIRGGIHADGFAVGEVRTACGSEEEGVWTWINLNDVLLDAFESDCEPVGIVEVGGSSLQLTVPTDEDPDLVPHVGSGRTTPARRCGAGSARTLVRAVPTRRDGATLLTWTRGYLIRRYSRPPAGA